MTHIEAVEARLHRLALQETDDSIGQQKMLGDVQAKIRVPATVMDDLLRSVYHVGGLLVAIESGLVLGIGHVNEDDDFVKLNALVEECARHLY